MGGRRILITGGAGFIGSHLADQSFSVLEVAERLAAAVGREDGVPEVTQRYRVGDVRHCFADVPKARRILGYAPTVSFEHGLEELATWLEGRIAHDRVSEASAELAARGLSL